MEAALCLAISAVMTAAMAIFSGRVEDCIGDAVASVLGLFAYRGHRWALIGAMVFWTLGKGYQIVSLPSSGAVGVIWWVVFMRFFYRALTVEQQRRRGDSASPPPEPSVA